MMLDPGDIHSGNLVEYTGDVLVISFNLWHVFRMDFDPTSFLQYVFVNYWSDLELCDG